MNKLEDDKKAIESFKKYVYNLEKQQNYLYDMEEYYKDDIEQNELFLKMLHSVLNYIENSIQKENMLNKEYIDNMNEGQLIGITKLQYKEYLYLRENSIPKKVIEERLEESKKEYNKIHAQHYRDCGKLENRIQAKILAYQELLEVE